MADETEVLEAEAPELTTDQQLENATDEAFKKVSEDVILGKDEKPAVVEPAKPAVQPDDQDGNEKPANEGLDEQTLKDLKEGKIFPKHRFDEVAQRMKAYEAFGSPEELAKKLAAIAPELKKPENEMTAEDKAARDYFLKLFPEFKKFENFEKFQQEMTARQEQEWKAGEERHTSLVSKGTDEIKKLATEAGLNVASERAVNLLIGGVTQVLHGNDELAKKFYRDGDITVLKTAFDDYFKEQFSGFQRAAKAKVLQDGKIANRLPKAPTKSGAAPADQPDAAPKSFEEAGNAAWDKFGG